PIVSCPPRQDPQVSQEAKPSGPDPRAGKAPRQEGKGICPAAQSLDHSVINNARLHGVDQKLVWAVMRQESGFNPQAVSPKGAMGLMQLMPATAVLMGVKDPFDVEQNIAGGVKYLSQCLSRFHGDVCLALAAYNAGPENVEKYQGCPPFPETQNYVAAVLRDYSGKSPPKGWRFAARNASTAPEISTPPETSGLHWQVPTPRWRLGKPEINIQAPRWKGKGRLSLPCPAPSCQPGSSSQDYRL
ncbi:MAG: lytic transglycosylase domain-containing protein, partial [Desulfobaccales bacterium]